MKNKILLFCCLLFIVSLPNIAYADIKKTIKGTIKEGLLEEFSGELVKLPGLKQIQEKIETNEFKLISTSRQRGILEIANYNDAENITLSRTRYGLGFKIFNDAVLASGAYWLKAQPKNTKQQGIDRKITITSGFINQIKLNFWEKGLKHYPLEISTIPKSARVRILNIVPKYKFSMPLPLGEYLVEVTHEGYKKVKLKIILDHNQNDFNFILQSLKVETTRDNSTKKTDNPKKEYSLGFNIVFWTAFTLLTLLTLWLIYRLVKLLKQLLNKAWKRMLGNNPM